MAAVWFQKRQRLAEVQQAHGAHAWCLGGEVGVQQGCSMCCCVKLSCEVPQSEHQQLLQGLHEGPG